MKSKTWTTRSRKVLFKGIKRVGLLLEEKVRSNGVNHKNLKFESIYSNIGIYQNLDAKSSALGKLCDEFDLSEFECQTLLLVAGSELVPQIGFWVSKIKGDGASPYPTLNLARKLFGRNKNFEHYSLLDRAALRDWELIRLKPSKDSWQFTDLEMDEDILTYLLGYSRLDKKLKNFVFPLSGFGSLPQNSKSLKDISLGIARAFETAIDSGGPNPLIQLCKSSFNLKQQIVTTVLEPFELPVYELSWSLMPTDIETWNRFELLWTRQVLLEDSVLLINCESIGKNDTEQLNLLNKFLTMMDAPIVVCTSQRLALSGRYVTTLEIPDLEHQEQQELWQLYLGEHAAQIPQHVESMVANFQLNPQEILSAVNSAKAISSSYDDLSEKLWATCREFAPVPN